MQISRLFEIVYLLLDHPSMTAASLAERFEVSMRTIYRDVEALSLAGIPIYTTQGKGGGIALLDNFVLNKSLISEMEQKQILAALQSVNAVAAQESAESLRKLGALFNSHDPNWVEVDFSAWSQNMADQQIFSDLKMAILGKKVVSIRYSNTRGDITDREVEPLKLVFKGQAWYLYGFCHARQANRFFKLNRVDDLKLSERTFVRAIPPKVLSENPLPKADWVTLRLKLDAAIAYRVYDEFPSAAVKDSDGNFLVEFTVPNGEWVSAYLLSFGEALEVLEPPAIREQLIRKVQLTLAKYKT